MQHLHNITPPHLRPLPPLSMFLKHTSRNAIWGLLILLSALSIGMIGYHYFENLSWVDSYINAAMILSGMGPLVAIKTTAGKIFAGTYALFSGIVFLITIAIIVAPLYHRFLHRFHLDE